MPNGGNLLLAGQYGWMGEYARDAANQRTPVDANGNLYIADSSNHETPLQKVHVASPLKTYFPQ